MTQRIGVDAIPIFFKAGPGGQKTKFEVKHNGVISRIEVKLGVLILVKTVRFG
ncbi:MAG: hypothetical protein MJK04_10275 [Psychrosphaera sp.]|nr:hypothetical protein [Psychrosphaera sp.]